MAWLVLAAVILLAGYASAFLPGGAPDFMAWLFMAASVGMMMALMAVGSEARRGLRLLLLGTFVGLSAVFALAFLLPPGVDPSTGELARLWGGLPPRAAVVIYGAGLLPLFVIPVAYAWTFRR